MSSIEEDAFARAQQMHSRVPYYSNNSQNRSQKHNVNEESEKKPPESPQKAETSGQKQNENDGNVLDVLFKNKEQSLILLLMILLMEEKADPTLLLALMYLLI